MTTKAAARVPKLYIGIDMHKKSWRVHWRTDLFDGSTKTFAPDAVKLYKYFVRHFPEHSVCCAYEAGGVGFGPARALQFLGWECLVVNPGDIPRSSKDRHVKTDTVDCENIARHLRQGSLRCITIPDEEREQVRSLFRRRTDLVKDLRRLKSRIKSHMLYHGKEIPAEYDNPNWSHAFVNWLIDVQWEYETAQHTLDSMIFHYRFVEEQIREVSNAVRSWCRRHQKKDYTLLRSIPGIGPLTAAALLIELGDMRRFTSFKQLASYIGLVPGIYQSGETVRTKGVTPRAHRLLRSYLVEAAWVAVRKDPVMQAYYRSHYGKNPKRIIVKVARKLLSRTLSVIKHEVPYQEGRQK